MKHIDSRYIADEDNSTSSKSERSRSSCNKLLTNKSNDENQIAKISPVQLITEITDTPNKDINASESNNDHSDQTLRNSPTKQKQVYFKCKRSVKCKQSNVVYPIQERPILHLKFNILFELGGRFSRNGGASAISKQRE